ncbi:hypothetical protein FB446DRAFT_795267 [Lentinula raphanica]|nr:hypothetical protein FB446DRAFT_795267 [Lentinula raphanica]
MEFFSPLGATLDQIFLRLVQIIVRWDNKRIGMIVRRLTLNEIKVLEYLAHVGWVEHERGGTIIANRLWTRATEYTERIQSIRRRLRRETDDGISIDKDSVTVGSFVPFEFFQPTRSFWMGPYAEQWSLQVVRLSVAAQMLWNNPFDLSKSINFNALTEPVPDLNHRVAFTPSDRLNVFFTRRPRDSTIRRDFTARFLYEEESVVLMGDELWPVLIYHVVYRRDIDFTLDQLEYEVHLSSSRRAGRGPRNPNYTFEWSRNKIEHKIYHRFYQYWIDADEKKWVVRERGTNKFVRGRRNAIE